VQIRTVNQKEQASAVITEIKRFATHDGPGIRTTVFIKGCPLRCKWCSNPETQHSYPEIYFIANKCQLCGRCQEVCPENAIDLNKSERIEREKCTRRMRCVEVCPNGALERVGVEVTPEKVAEKVIEDSPFYTHSGGGITLSGGEPLTQPAFAARLFEICHENNISTVLDTSGYAKPEAVFQVLQYTDLVLLDIKTISSEEHRIWTGVSNELILENAKLMASKTEVRISLALIPGVNDSKENIDQTADFVRSIGIKYIDVLPFHRLGQGKYQSLGLKWAFKCKKVSDKEVQKAMERIEARGLMVTKGRMM